MKKSIGLLALLTFGAACGPPPSGTATESPENTESLGIADSTSPCGFEQWLAAECPDGVTVRFTRPLTAEQRDVSCVEIREMALAEGPLHDILMFTYVSATSGPDAIGEAQQPFTPFGVGLALALGAVSVASGFDCQHRPNDVHCWKGTGFIVPLLGIIAAFLF